MAYVGIPLRMAIIIGNRINRWIQVIAEIQSNGANWGVITHSQSRRVGEVIEAA
jgi:hypothetical protein